MIRHARKNNLSIPTVIKNGSISKALVEIENKHAVNTPDPKDSSFTDADDIARDKVRYNIEMSELKT